MLRLFKKLAPYTILVILAVLLMAGQAVLELFLPDRMAEVIALINTDDSTKKMLLIGGQALAFSAGALICSSLVVFLSAKIAMAFGRDLRRDIFAKIESFSPEEFDKLSTASLITRVTNDVTQVTNYLTMAIRMMIFAPIMMIGGITMALLKNFELTTVIWITIPLITILILSVIIFARPLFKAMQLKIDRLTQVAREGLTGVRVIRAFDNDGLQTARFDTANKDLTANTVKVNIIMAVMLPAVNIIFSLTAIAIFWVGSLNADNIRYLADMTAVMQYSFRIMMAFMFFSFALIMLPRASASATRINEVLAIVPKIQSPLSPAVIEAPSGLLEFRNVTFRFASHSSGKKDTAPAELNDAALEGVTFTAEPGKTTAIIGGTGSGKTTILNLINRFYDPESGEILLDGVDIRTLNTEDLRSRLGFVPQTAILFTGTVKDNIRYGKPDADDEEIRRACRIAQADAFISEMTGGYDSEVVQGGKNFSGGQKQRLCIARAVVRNPLVYLFDDSFSALDYVTDAKLRAALKAETANATRIIVAQRVGTIMDADTIIVLTNGKIAGQGTHKELLKTCPDYLEIVSSQFREDEIGL